MNFIEVYETVISFLIKQGIWKKIYFSTNSSQFSFGWNDNSAEKDFFPNSIGLFKVTLWDFYFNQFAKKVEEYLGQILKQH